MSSETVVMHKSKGLSHLIYDAQRGDSEAVRALLGACQADARRYAYKHCHASDIDDAVQESLLLITRKIHALRATAAFSSWLFIVIKRECRRLSRAMFRQAPLEEDLAEQRLTCKSDDDLRLDLAAALESLPHHYLEVVLLRDFEELTIAEIAQRLDQPAVRFAKVDTESSPQASVRYRIRSIPTMVLFKNGE